MSLRHCIAGAVLVAVGGLAVHAYQDQPVTSGDTDRMIDEIVRLEWQMKNTSNNSTKEGRARKNQLEALLDVAKARLDVVQRLSNEEPNVTAGALELADEPQPRKKTRPPNTYSVSGRRRYRRWPLQVLPKGTRRTDNAWITA